jgi:hypothetical protein
MLYAPLTSHMRSTCPPISSFLLWSPWYYWAKSTNHAAPHYAVFSNLLSLHPS